MVWRPKLLFWCQKLFSTTLINNTKSTFNQNDLLIPILPNKLSNNGTHFWTELEVKNSCFAYFGTEQLVRTWVKRLIFKSRTCPGVICHMCKTIPWWTVWHHIRVHLNKSAEKLILPRRNIPLEQPPKWNGILQKYRSAQD